MVPLSIHRPSVATQDGSSGLSVVECCGTTKFRIVNSPRKRVIWSETRFDQRPLPRSTVHPVQSRSSTPSLDVTRRTHTQRDNKMHSRQENLITTFN